MVTLIVTHEVKNFSEWKKGYENDGINRQQAGIKDVAIFTSATNPNMVTIIMEAPSMELVNGLMGDAKFQEAMENAGVISVPEVKILNKV